MAGQQLLGRLADISVGLAPYDTNSGAGTGKRVSLTRAAGLTVVFFKAAGSGTDDPVLTFQQHTATSSGTTSNLAVIDHYYSKSATTLAGTETWTKTTQAASQTVTLTGEAQKQGVYVFEIAGTQLSDTYICVSVNIADTGAAGAQWGSVWYFLHDLSAPRRATNLPAGLS